MPAFVSAGRFLFAVLFIFTGASKLLDLPTTTQLTQKIVVPEMLTAYTSQLEGFAGMPFAQMLAIAAGATELICGLMIALNFGARFFALVLVLFVAATIFYYHDFWNQTGVDAQNNLIAALKNLSLIGALLIIAGIGRGAPAIASSHDG
ncbi:DoxX family protein [Rhodopseudomonas palustris]|jgi:putative oxidoreductase|uniref:DoxX family protein n=1 Tax=Rhodopseudomonas palustris TaxID=1076 RepID=UPI0020CB72D4|nr:DoxX family protein [Rhodopseudomonas palustris]MCP9626998.1 DoxX family protein [Rhodopseudomonas palustris]